jgi:hypothetical protein
VATPNKFNSNNREKKPSSPGSGRRAVCFLTCDTAYALIDDIRHPGSKNFGTLLWYCIFPPKIEIFMLLLLHGIMSTGEFLAYKRIINYYDACSFYGMETDTIDHLFIHCYVTWRF